jgi:iron complex outermembrane receptor protein
VSTWRIVIGLLIAFTVELAFSAERQGKDLFELSLEQLGEIEVTSVSRRSERLQDAAASIFVISAEDIRRSGATVLPEALRIAPNLQVARISASSYAISARGANNAIGNKLLVLIDGRTVYSPLFSGVFWDAQDVMLEDVERIEVISGPGAALWGANAVNGVINVITRSAQDTQGALAAAGGGNREAGGAARYGGTFGTDGHYRVYGKGFNQFNTERANGSAVKDRFDRGQAGFRTDWGGADSNFTVQGDAYTGVSEAGPAGKPTIEGMNLLGRWNGRLADDSTLRIQAYYDRAERDDPFTYANKTDTVDIEFQHGFLLAGQHKVLWGGGYRNAHDSTQTHFIAQNILPQAFVPSSRNLHWSNLFVQDEVPLGPKVDLTIGAKVETNVYTGAEYLPNVRLAWKVTDRHTVWGEASRAVRAPARLDTDFRLYLKLPGALIPIINGGPDFKSEVANVFEIGYRAQPVAALTFSLTGFRTINKKLRSGQPPPAFIQNMIEGSTNGVEGWATFQPASIWRLSAGFVELRQQLGLAPGSRDPTGPSALGTDPKHQWQLRSALNLTEKHDFDVAVRHVGPLEYSNIPAYTAVDLRFGWRMSKVAELSLTLQNLFDPGHVEFGTVATASEVGRSAFLKLLLRM